MSIFNNTAEVEVRERRLHSVLSYSGNAAELAEKSKNKELRCKGRYYGQCGSCAETCAETRACYIKDAAVINHSPVGCASSVAGYKVHARAGSAARGLDERDVHFINSNIQEKDTVYGAAAKLKKAIAEADKRFKPRVTFILASCASGIIGEDLESVANEAEAQYGYPIIPIYCEGFKSKIWASGFDAAYHGVLRKLAKKAEKRQDDLVNICNFVGSDNFAGLLGRLNLRVNYVTDFSTIEGITQLTEAACTASICETLSTYLGGVLEEKYGVPEVHAPSPYGINWTDQWLREIAGYTNRTELAERLIEEEHKRIEPQLNELREKFAGKRIYVIAGDAYAHNMSNIVKDLGFEIVGITTLHRDQHTDISTQKNTLKDLVDSYGNIENYSVCNKQPYQIIKLLKKTDTDFLLVRHPGLAALGAKLGIPTVFEGDPNSSIGYDGVINMGERLDEAAQTIKFTKNIAEHTELPYTDWWLNEVDDPFYFEGGIKK